MASCAYRRIGSPMLLAISFSISAIGANASGTSPGPYAGQQSRTIKSLSDQDVAALVAGQGAGFAKAAELNGYPGPAHVLELANALQLDVSQINATRELMAAHQSRARQLGIDLVAAEADLDRLFANKKAQAVDVDQATAKVGLLQGRLRAEHLDTHLAQTALLSSEQVHLYSVLRGYASVDTPSTPTANDASSPAHRHH